VPVPVVVAGVAGAVACGVAGAGELSPVAVPVPVPVVVAGVAGAVACGVARAGELVPVPVPDVGV
jgi:hypothetical protein